MKAVEGRIVDMIQPAAVIVSFLLQPVALSQTKIANSEPETPLVSQSRPTSQSMLFPDISSADGPIRERIEKAQKEVLESAEDRGSRAAAAYGKLGELYHAFGFTDAAMACYGRAGSLDPTEFRWHYYEAVLARNAGQLATAQNQFRLALELRPNDDLAQVRLAELYDQENRTTEAERIYKSILARNPSSVAAMHGLGQISLARHQFTLAAQYLERALVIDPEAAYLHYPLAMAYRGMGKTDKAQQEVNKHGPASPSLPDPYLAEIQDLKTGRSELWIRGSTEMSVGDFASAISTYTHIVELDPQDGLAKTYLGTALARAGRTEDALNELSEASDQDPSNAETQYCLGIVLVRLGRDPSAIKHIRRALKSDPNLKEAHFELANALMRNKEFREAVVQYGLALQENPKNGFAAVMQAMAFVRQGDYRSAESILERAHDSIPGDRDIDNALARILAAAPDATLRDGPRAVQIMRAMITANGAADLDESASIAMALAETGQFERAAQIQRSVIENSESESSTSHLSFLRDDLDAYEHHRACRTPWHEEDPIFLPIPLHSSGPILPLPAPAGAG